MRAGTQRYAYSHECTHASVARHAHTLDPTRAHMPPPPLPHPAHARHDGRTDRRLGTNARAHTHARRHYTHAHTHTSLTRTQPGARAHAHSHAHMLASPRARTHADVRTYKQTYHVPARKRRATTTVVSAKSQTNLRPPCRHCSPQHAQIRRRGDIVNSPVSPCRLEFWSSSSR
eukprot:952121-Pleurochrysis_carterae.AAC.2